MKRVIVAAAVVAACAVVAGVCWWCLRGGQNQPVETPEQEEGPKSIATNGTVVAKGQRRAQRRKELTEDEKKLRKAKNRRHRGTPAEEYTPEEQRLSDAVQAALDEDNFEGVVKSAREALASSREEVRQEAVDALGWFGEKALSELTKAMSDKSESVADSARSHIETALTGMDDQEQAFLLAASYLAAFSDNKDAATMLSGVMSSAAMQLIDPDDPDSPEDVAKAKQSRLGFVEHLEELMKLGESGSAVAKELYEEVAGEAWSSSEDAMKWANDIADPEPDEEPAEEDPAEEETKPDEAVEESPEAETEPAAEESPAEEPNPAEEGESNPEGESDAA